MPSGKIGILTAGGDCPGLNAAIRGVGKAVQHNYDMTVIGFYDGFRGLMEDRYIELDAAELTNLLTRGGTILGTSRDKPHRMVVAGREVDMTDTILKRCRKHRLEALVCVGGGGTQKNAFRLSQKGLNIITLPKTIDNDVYGTDVTFGFDTAMNVATEAIDRLHTTAHSHHRIILVEIMGHQTGWLTLGSGVAGGADVILIPEIPYDSTIIAEAIRRRRKAGKHFSIVAVAEGAVSKAEHKTLMAAIDAKKRATSKKEVKAADAALSAIYARKDHALNLSRELEGLTDLESRVTILGYLQRGGSPSPADRLLATRLGTACAALVRDKRYGVMVASRGDKIEPVLLKDIVGKRKNVPLDHCWIESARRLGVCLGD